MIEKHHERSFQTRIFTCHIFADDDDVEGTVRVGTFGTVLQGITSTC
jgi:hypothetical protein